MQLPVFIQASKDYIQLTAADVKAFALRKRKKVKTNTAFSLSTRELREAYGQVRQMPNMASARKPKSLADSVRTTFNECLELIRKKNHDYASEENEYRNFEAGLRIGISVQKSIMLRLQDKIARLENLMTKEAYVTEESLEDTALDAINYLAILKARREYEKQSEHSA